MEWFKKMSVEEQIETVCEMYFDYGVNGDKDVLKQAKEMKEILIKETLFVKGIDVKKRIK